jgi:hypothetical protein
MPAAYIDPMSGYQWIGWSIWSTIAARIRSGSVSAVPTVFRNTGICAGRNSAAMIRRWNSAAALSIKGLCQAPLTRRGMTLPPRARMSAVAADSAASSPETTVWVGAL